MSPNPKTIAYQEMMKYIVETATNRFLSWKLPKDFSPDGGISFTPMKHSETIGTHLLTAQQAKEMLQYVTKEAFTSSYLHQLEEEVKRLRKDKRTMRAARKTGSEAGWGVTYGWNEHIDSEIALCEEAIKEIKALQ